MKKVLVKLLFVLFILVSHTSLANPLFSVTGSASNLTIKTTIPNHTYPNAGIKVTTSGASISSGCTPFSNGMCLFPVSDTKAAHISIAGRPTSGLVRFILCLNGIGKLSCQNYSIGVGGLSQTVGGTVFGLQIGNLILQNNGTDNLVISANGTFTFRTPLAPGSTFSVTVLNQPPQQTCIVADGTGTIGNTPVTNIEVTCFPTLGVGAMTVPANKIMKLNILTNTWVPFGATNDASFNIAVNYYNTFNGRLLVGGIFTSPTNHLAKLVSNTWVPFGATNDNLFTGGFVFTLFKFNGTLLVGGIFSDGGNLVNIAKYDQATNTFVRFGALNDSSFNNGVNGFAIFNGQLVAVGGFTVPGNRIVKYDQATNTWIPFGATNDAAFNNAITSVTIFQGNLIVSNNFTAPANRIAKYDQATNTWIPFGATNDAAFNSIVVGLSTTSPDLIAAGDFSAPANRIARYNVATNTWVAFGATNDAAVNSEMAYVN